MKFLKNILLMFVTLTIVPVYASLRRQPTMKVKGSMEAYVVNKTAELQKLLISDIFPKKGTIERLVRAFKEEYPGPDKDIDTGLIYNAIIKNPEIKKRITLENAVPIYKFVRKTIDETWQEIDDEIWRR
jgi:hypothetical protein